MQHVAKINICYKNSTWPLKRSVPGDQYQMFCSNSQLVVVVMPERDFVEKENLNDGHRKNLNIYIQYALQQLNIFKFSPHCLFGNLTLTPQQRTYNATNLVFRLLQVAACFRQATWMCSFNDNKFLFFLRNQAIQVALLNADKLLMCCFFLWRNKCIGFHDTNCQQDNNCICNKFQLKFFVLFPMNFKGYP